MSKVCYICGKAKMSGNHVSHSNRKTPRTYGANLIKTDICDEKGRVSTEYVCARCLRTIKKHEQEQ